MVINDKVEVDIKFLTHHSHGPSKKRRPIFNFAEELLQNNLQIFIHRDNY